jgi:cyanate lyase
MEKQELVAKLLAAKKASGKTYDEIAESLGYCNVYVGQLFQAQAQLKENAVSKTSRTCSGSH